MASKPPFNSGMLASCNETFAIWSLTFPYYTYAHANRQLESAWGFTLTTTERDVQSQLSGLPPDSGLRISSVCISQGEYPGLLACILALQVNHRNHPIHAKTREVWFSIPGVAAPATATRRRVLVWPRVREDPRVSRPGKSCLNIVKMGNS